jgi:hypothetical protein
VPNTFEEQAKDRFHKSHAFMQKATALLQDDLVYRSALADAVSSIKNMLQGYLLLRVARTPASAVTQRWQEVAASNRMPDLIQACGEAGLDLRGLAVEIKRLNNERNYRTHDDPQRLVDPDQAAYALDLAQTVQKRIRAANQGTSAAGITPAAIPTANRRATTSADSARQAPAQQQAADPPLLPLDDNVALEASDATGANGHTEPLPPSVAPAEEDVASSTPAITQAAADSPIHDDDMPAAVESQDDDEALLPDDTSLTLPVVTRRRTRIGRALVQTLIAAMLVIAGVAAGAGLTLPIAMGHTPQWLSFATQYLPADATPSPTSTPIPTATPSPTTGPVTVGALTVQSTPCQASVTTLTLHNTGTAPLRWALGAPDTPAATFTVGKSATGATQFGTLAARASVDIVASAPAAGGTYRVVVVAPEGTVQLLLAAC